MRRSSLDTIDVGIDRELSSQFDDVKLVAGSIDDVIRVSAAIEDGSLEDANSIAGSIQTVVAIAEDVVIVSENMDNIQGILDNIVDVQNAEENALVTTARAAESLVSAATATSQASIATNKATEAAVSEANALASENSAKISEDKALISATNASVSEAISLASKNIAIASANTATTKASEASSSATSASASAASALVDKVSAENSATTATTKASEALSSANVASSQAGVATTKASEALASANSALVSENKAEKWASELEDVEVEPGEYSAKHWALKAKGFAEGDSAKIGYDNVGSGLVATNVQDAIDQLDENVDELTANTYTKTEVRESLPNIGLDLAASVVVAAGQIAWNADEGTADLGLNSDVTLQLGQEELVLVKNSTGATIANGKVVMVVGSNGNSGNLLVALHGGTKANAVPTLGITTQDIADGASGFVTKSGKVRGINTSGSTVGETWVDGDVLYVAAGGNLTKVVPGDTGLKMSIAVVINAHGSNGTLFVRTNGLDENHDKDWTISKITTHTSNVSNPHSVTKSQVGLGNVDNTSDANKPVSTATQSALNLKANLTSPTFTGTVSGITKSMVGLGFVDNTADTVKVVASAGKWTTARTITLNGDLSGSVSIDGSANVTLSATVNANSVALGTDTTGNYVADVTAGTGIAVTGTAEEGWSPTVALGTVGTAGTYRSVTTDAYGRVTAGANPTTVAGYGLTDVFTKTEVQTVLPKVGFDTSNVTAPTTGQLAWNGEEATLDLGINGATLQIGQEQLIRVRNHSGSSITNGRVVMATGTLGNSGRIVVGPANLTQANAKYVLGVVTETIANGADGFCTTFGKVRGINTTGSDVGETWLDGDVLYVKDSGNGVLTKVVPTDSQVKLPVAIVISAHGSNGTLFVRVSSIDENHAKVELVTKVDKNANIVAGTGTKITYDTKGLVTGSTTLNASDIPSLDASKITSGTLSVGTSGNAATATRVNNAEVIKFDTGVTEGTDLYTFNGSAAKTINIKAGTNVTLTKAAGSITINANDTSIAVTEITGMGVGASTFLAAPTSTNLAAMLTDETGTGAAVFANSPTLTGTPVAPTATVGTNTTQLATTAFVVAEINKIEEW